MDIKQKVKNMTLEEKIGQKIMLDFRYWDRNGSSNQDMTVPDEAIGKLIADNHVGGVILFANNLKDKQQINTLTARYAAMKTHAGIRLFIGTDNEGGNVSGCRAATMPHSPAIWRWRRRLKGARMNSSPLNRAS